MILDRVALNWAHSRQKARRSPLIPCGETEPQLFCSHLDASFALLVIKSTSKVHMAFFFFYVKRKGEKKRRSTACSVQAGDEESGFLGEKKCQCYEQEDAGAMGPS
jgi:hypothetical protein